MLYGDFGAGMKTTLGKLFLQNGLKRLKHVGNHLKTCAFCIVEISRWILTDWDVARGGGDNTIGFPRYGYWYDNPNVLEGKDSPDGQQAHRLLSHMFATMRHSCRCHWRWCKYIRFLKAIRYSRCTCGRTQCCNCIRPFRATLVFTTCVHNSGGSSVKH